MQALTERRLELLRQLAFAERVQAPDLSRALAEAGATLREIARELEAQGQDLRLAEQNRLAHSKKAAAARKREAAKKDEEVR
jgi:hypothetical protein